MMDIALKEKLLLTAREVAAATGIHVDDVYRLGAAGEIPSMRIGKRTRYPVSEVLAWIERNTTGTAV